MHKSAGSVKVSRTIAGITAVLTIVAIMTEDDLGTKELLGQSSAIAAALSFFYLCLYCRREDSPPRVAMAMREALSLEAHGLSMRERQLVLEMLSGKSMKEISIDHGIGYSTVRNTFSSAYQKLHVLGRAELLILGERYRIE